LIGSSALAGEMLATVDKTSSRAAATQSMRFIAFSSSSLDQVWPINEHGCHGMSYVLVACGTSFRQLIFSHPAMADHHLYQKNMLIVL
jgi:hypothetical protein